MAIVSEKTHEWRITLYSRLRFPQRSQNAIPGGFLPVGRPRGGAQTYESPVAELAVTWNYARDDEGNYRISFDADHFLYLPRRSYDLPLFPVVDRPSVRYHDAPRGEDASRGKVAFLSFRIAIVSSVNRTTAGSSVTGGFTVGSNGGLSAEGVSTGVNTSSSFQRQDSMSVQADFQHGMTLTRFFKIEGSSPHSAGGCHRDHDRSAYTPEGWLFLGNRGTRYYCYFAGERVSDIAFRGEAAARRANGHADLNSLAVRSLIASANSVAGHGDT